MTKKVPLQSPGEYLSNLLEKNNLNPFKLSKDIYLSQSAVRLIALGKTRISVPVALRLAKYFNNNPEFWLTMQMQWDLVEAEKDKDLMGIVKNISEYKKEAKSPAGKKAAAVPETAAKKKGKTEKKSAGATTKRTGKSGNSPAK